MNASGSHILQHTDRSVRNQGASLGRAGILAYGVGSYAIGVTALVYMILLTLGVLDFRSEGIHLESTALAVLFNAGLATAFGLQHSVMARESFKERWVRVIHPSMERSSYVLATGLVLLPLLLLWQPLPAVVWEVHAPLARGVLTAIGALGWAYLFLSTFAIDHFELFGLQQVWRGFRGKPPAAVPFKERWMYRFDRHPIMSGVLVAMWVTPQMTLGHLLLAATLSLYVVVGVHFEERALRRRFGNTYETYRRRVGTIVPLLPPR